MFTSLSTFLRWRRTGSRGEGDLPPSFPIRESVFLRSVDNRKQLDDPLDTRASHPLVEIETSRVKERASEQCRAIKWNTSDGGGMYDFF